MLRKLRSLCRSALFAWFAASEFDTLKRIGLFFTTLEMPSLSHVEAHRRQRWYAFVVLVAGLSLIVSVATRYCASGNLSVTTAKTFEVHASPKAKRQHLAEDADHWVPPMICLSPWQSLTSYPRITPAGLPIPGSLFEESLYNRPPPTFESLSR